MARKRNRENIGLPSRWRFRYNAYYYHPPADLREYWDNKAEFRLGRSLSPKFDSREPRTGIFRLEGPVFWGFCGWI